MPEYILKALENWYSLSLLKTKNFLDSLEAIKAMTKNDPAIMALEDLIIYNLGFLLFEEIDRAKIKLSSQDKESIYLNQKSIHIQEEITRLEFETEINDLLSKAIACVDEGLQNAGVSSNDISRIVTTGGSSLIPKMRQLLVEKFPQSEIEEIEVFGSVVKGLGIRAGQIFS
jgi:hypothetical chaperone protein